MSNIYNLTGRPLAFGPDGFTLPPHAAVRVVYGPAGAAPPLDFTAHGGEVFPAFAQGTPARVEGFDWDAHDGPDAVFIVPALVADAMAQLGIRVGKAVYSPGILKQAASGEWYAERPVYHPDVSGNWR